MAEAYVTLAEAAELEGLGYEALKKRIQRKEKALDIKTEKSKTGGRDKVFIAVSSLSKQAQAAYRERKRLEETQGEELDLSQAPWYVTSDPDWYMANYKANYYKGIEMRGIVQKFIKELPQAGKKNRTKFTEDFAREHIHKDGRTFYRHVKTYYEAGAWASRMGRLDGLDYDWITILALCRKPKEKGRFPSFSEEVRKTIAYIWFNKEFAMNRGTVGMLYERLTEIAEQNGWGHIPSYQSVCRYVTWMMEDERMKNAHTLAADGLKEYRNKVMVKGRRDTRSLKVMEVVMGDEHTFDCWVSYTNENGKTSPIRPKLVAWIDVRSRSIMGDVLCKDANSQILKESLLRMIYQEHGGVPKELYIDNGKDYVSRTMTGRPRNVRSGDPLEEFHGNELAFDDEVIGFYRAIGVQDDHRALPYQPWSKGQVERFFETVCGQFTKWMASYTGTLTGSSTSDKVNKDIKQMFEKGQLLTMEEFCEAWRGWLEKYHHKMHRELKKVGEEWVTPWELFENGERYEKGLPPKSRATMLMLKSDNVLVRNTGISRWGYDYRAQELCDYINEKVLIKYDPNDVSVLYVFDRRTKKRICEAVSQELLAFAPGVGQKRLEEHIRMQKTQEKRDKKRLAETQDLGDLTEKVTGFNPVTGGLDLMIRGKGKPAKVIALPGDPAYRNNLEMRKRRQGENPYIARKAQEALEKMKALESV